MNAASPRREGFHMPAEWAPHRAVWLAWPSAADLWLENLGPAQASFTALCRAIADLDEQGRHRGELLEVLVPDDARAAEAARALEGLSARFHRIPFGDIWLRDIAPLFLRGPSGARATVRFAFNGWGGKYVLPHDDRVAAQIARAAGQREFSFPWVLEGGSVELDGEGTVLTTRQCLLNPNRNPGMGQAAVEEGLCEALGAQKVLWLDEGLLRDHTDGHIDTLARFVAPGRVVCMRPSGPADPNAQVLARIAEDLAKLTDAAGRRLEVVQVPSPGLVEDDEGQPMPASYVNYYQGNRAVVVPTYGSPHDEQAVAELARLFPGRRTVGVPAKAILSGGGAFHCISQQEPLP